MGEPEKTFKKVTQIPSSESFEQSFKMFAESYDESGPIYENIGNMKGTPPNSKDAKRTPLLIPENPTKEADMGLSQLSSAEVQQKSQKKKPPPVVPKPSIRKHKHELNTSEIQSTFVTEGGDPKKTVENKCLLEVEQEPIVRQPLGINDSPQESSQLEMEMVDRGTQEKEESAVQGNSLEMQLSAYASMDVNEQTEASDIVKQVYEECCLLDDAEETADAEQRPQKDIQFEYAEYVESSKKVSDLMKIFESNKTRKDVEDGFHQFQLSADENEPITEVFELPLESTPVQKRPGNSALKPYKLPLAEPESVEQFISEEAQKDESDVQASPVEPCKTQKYDHNESRLPNEKILILPPLPPKSLVITDSLKHKRLEDEGKISGKVKHAEPNRKQEEQQTWEKKETEKPKDEPEQTTPNLSKRAKKSWIPKASTDRKKNVDSTVRRDKEKKDITSPKQPASKKSQDIVRQCQDSVGSSPQPVTRKEEQKQGKGAKSAYAESEEESVAILDAAASSDVSLKVNDEMGEPEKTFKEVTQIPSSESFEQSFKMFAESYDESGPIYENIGNMKGTPPNSKDAKRTPLLIPENPTKEADMGLSQLSSAEVQQKSQKKKPPPVVPKPSIRKHKHELNTSEIQSTFVTEGGDPKKTVENKCLLEVEQEPIVRQPLGINDSPQESSQLEMEMVDRGTQEKEESAVQGNSLEMQLSAYASMDVNEQTEASDIVKQVSEEYFLFDDAEETADAEQRPLKDIKIDDVEQSLQDEKQIGDSFQYPLIESQVDDTEERPQEDTYVDDAEERIQKNTHMDKTQGRFLKDIQIGTSGKSPQDSKDDAEHRPQKDIQFEYAEHVESSKKVSDFMKIFESNKTRKDAEDGFHQFQLSADENEPITEVSELPLESKPVQKRPGNSALKSYKRPLAEPESVEQFISEESKKDESDVPESFLEPCETQKYNHNESRFPNEMILIQPPLPPKSLVITESVKQKRLEDEALEDSRPPTPPPRGIAVMESLKHIRLKRATLESPELTRSPTPPPKTLEVMKTYKPEAQPYVTSEPSVAQSTPPSPPRKRSSDQSMNQRKQQKQQQQQQKQQHQQEQQHPKLHVPQGEVSDQAKHAEPNRKQEKQQKWDKKEIEKANDEPEKITPISSKRAQTSSIPKQPVLRKSQDIVRQCQDSVGSSSQPAKRKEEQKQGKGAKGTHTKSEELATELGYTMVIGLSESTSDDNLWNFMESQSNADLKEIVFGTRRENAVVVFERKPDHENLQNRVSKKTLDGKFLEVFDMPPPTSIIVSTKEPKEFSTDTLTLHFESKTYGGAELVEDGIKITEDGCYIMTFTDSDAVERVCAIQHKVENTQLNVSPYYQCKKWAAWNTAIHGINIPAPFAHQVDPILLKYLQSFSRAMEAMQRAKMEMHAGIELQENAILVTCLLSPEVKGYRKFVTSWRRDAEEHWNKFLSSTFQIEKISNLSDIWDDFVHHVKSMIKGKEIMLVEERFESHIQLVGFIDEVTGTHGEVMGEKEKFERIRKVGKETMPLKSAAKKRLLDRGGIFKRLKAQFSDFDVFLEPFSEEIVLSGVPTDRKSATLQIYEELRKFDEPVVIHDSTEYFSQFIKECAPRNYIINEMETNSLIVDWDVSIENGHVFVYCIPADSAQHAATLMKKMVRETNITLSESEQLVVTTEKWTMYQAETESKCDGLVHIVVTNDLKNVIFISMEGIHAEILEDLKDFIKKKTVVEEMIQCNLITKKFMQTVWKPEDYQEIEKNSGDKHLQLTWQDDRLTVKGTVEGVQKTKELWKEKTSKIIDKSHILKRVGIKEVLLLEEQQGTLKAFEKEHRCLIQIENSDLPSHEEISRGVEMDEGETVYDTVNESMIVETPKSGPYRCQNGLTISLTKSELAQQKVDVIVCATSPDLNLNSGATSKSLLQWGGQGLQDECKTKYAGKIQEGEVVDIDGGDLQCDRVYLTVLPDWKKSNNGQSLRNVVIKCLVQAHGDSKRSIAFAAMGTGQLHYPHHDVARLMYDACIGYDSKNPQSSVKKVHFVIYEKDTDSVRAFEKEEKNILCGGVRPRSSTPASQEHLVGNVKISQIVEELENQQVDAILCSCAENLVLSQSGACATLLRVGGKSLQDECRIKYPNGIKHGHIAIIGGGNLKCKHVFLTALPQYAENGNKVLFDVITAALQLAATKGCKSIAMPAMGSGYLKYPAALVAKVMYDAVGDWAKKNTTTSLTAVKFVLFFKDKSTQDAFRDQLTRINIRQQRSVSIYDVKTLPEDSSCIIIDPSDDSACTVGKVKVKVYTGDILNEKTDAIVNSVDADFSFQGGVSLLLKKKCQGLKKKCQDEVEKLRQSGVVMTDSFGLKCKKIFHVKFQDNLMGWKRVMKKCLEKASKHKLSSIAFPVLGTGDGHTSFPADKISEMFFEALIDFDDENQKHRLQHVNVIVYHKQPQFIPAIKKGMVKVSNKGPRETTRKTLDRLKDMVMLRSGLVEHQRTPVLSRSQMSQVTIQVYSDSELNINDCITNLEKKLDKAYTSTPLIDDLIAKMSPQEVKEFFETDLLVECEFIQEKKQVLIRGTPQNVSRAQNEFHGKLRNRARKESEKEEAEQLYQMVRWHYEEVTKEETKLIPYDKLINLRMEKAFKNDETYLELPDHNNDQVFIVDFKTYVEYVKGGKQDSVKIVRKDILKAKGALPITWDEMQDKENLKRINVLNPSAEYQQLESIFLREAKTGPYSSRIPNVQNIKVLKIERIQNKTLYQQYSAKKKSMETRYNDKPTVTIEQKVWHGTPYNSIDGICTHGFNRSYCGKNGVWYGHGVYFATNASYSARGWLTADNQAPQPGTKQYIFYVSVCVGEFIQGNQNMRVLPAKNKSNPTDIYDSAVNDVNNVEEIVIFNDTQAYPDYLITFTT